MQLNADLSHNQLLESLPGDVMQRLQGSFKICMLPLGRSLYEAGEPMHYVYFPVDAVVSQLNFTREGNTTEVLAVGNEGMLGINVFMGAPSSPTRAVVQCTGKAYYLGIQAALTEFERHSEFMKLVLHYTQSVISKIGYTAACIRHHTLQQRLCRWLLQSLDRCCALDVSVTHELLATLLGVRREGVSATIGHLQKMGLIDHYRGHIRVLDRDRLEQFSCECYQVVKAEDERFLRTLVGGQNFAWTRAGRGTKPGTGKTIDRS